MAAFPGRPDPKVTLAKLFIALVAAGVLAAGLALPYVGGLGLVAGREAQKFQDTQCQLPDSKPPQRTTLYARDGKTVIATLFTQDRSPVPLSEVPKTLQEALVATEDRRFYSHHGVDLRGLIRSAVSTSGGDTQGGSTLTMQYVKQLRYYLAGSDKKKQQQAIAVTLNRKIEDAKCALYIEGTLHKSKAQILDDYLNIAFFGENSYSIQTAAETYFNKPASQLTLGESAMLVGLLRAPTDFDPFLHRAASTARRNQVLQNLVSVGKLSQAAANAEKAKPIALATKSPPIVRQGCANAGSTTVPNTAFFCEYAQSWLENVNKISSTELNTGGLKIVTTLDPALQTSMQTKLAKAVPAKSSMTAVLPAVDPKTGDVLAMATSKTYGVDAGQTEQPVFTADVANGASTWKLFPLLTALQTGVPTDWPLLTTGSGEYKPKFCAANKPVKNGDADESYADQETLTTATAKSSNTYFVGLADNLFNCQLDPIVTMASKLGMSGLSDASDLRGQNVGQAIESAQRAAQLVLGSVPTSPLQLASAYAAVANGGTYIAPSPILSITDSDGSAISLHRSTGVRVVSPEAAAQAVQILTDDTQGVGTSAGQFSSWYDNGGSDVAGKTGTVAAVKNGKETTKNAAIWFVGMTPRLVATSALINFDAPNSPSTGLPDSGGTGAAYGDYASGVWLKALGSSLSGSDWTWTDPADVSGQEVPDLTGMSLDDAKTALAADNLTLSPIGSNDALRCPITGGEAPYDTIAYYGPHIATPGSTITVCQSLGTGQPVYVPPTPSKRRGNTTTNRPGGITIGNGNGSDSGNNDNANNGGSSSGSSGSGNGNSGSGNSGSGNSGSGNGNSGSGNSGSGGRGNGGSGSGN